MASASILPDSTLVRITVVVFARFLGAFIGGLRTFTLAFMVDIARRGASRVCFAVGIAFVHQIDNFCIGECQGVAMTLRSRISDGKLVILVASQNRELAIGRKRRVSVMHDRAEVVFNTKRIRISLLVKVEGIRLHNVLVVYLQRVVSVDSALFVVKTDGVPELV